MRAQDLEYTRTELRRALVDYSGKTKGQLQAFSETPLAEKNRLTRNLSIPSNWRMGRAVKERYGLRILLYTY